MPPLSPTLVRGARTLVGGQLLTSQELLVQDGVVVAVGPVGSLGAHEVLVADLVAPGFVDLHVHAVDGRGMVDDHDVAGLSEGVVKHGVTSFLATTVAAPLATLIEALTVVAAAGELPARCLGVHLEGPWLSPARAGAQPIEHLLAPEVTDLEALLSAGPVRLVTLAPELAGAADVIVSAVRAGVVVSLGHSDATAAQALRAVDLGASHVTHCFNAMSGMHHREGGLVEAAFDHGDLTVEVIADGQHVSPTWVRALIAAAGRDRVCLVSDAVDLDLPGEAAARLPDGRLAGSRIGLDGAVRNLVSWGVPLADALLMAAATPARAVGRADLGRIEVGAPADLVLLDADLQVSHTMRGGELVWRR